MKVTLSMITEQLQELCINGTDVQFDVNTFLNHE